MNISAPVSNDIQTAAAEIAHTHRRITAPDSQPAMGHDMISHQWSDCVGWLAECRPDVAEMLRTGRVREAMGIAFSEGIRKGELLAFWDPEKHAVLGAVDGRYGDAKVPVQQLKASRKRRADHAKANNIVTAEIQRVMNHPPAGTWEEKAHLLCSRRDLEEKLRSSGVPKRIAKGAIPAIWPKERPGPK